MTTQRFDAGAEGRRPGSARRGRWAALILGLGLGLVAFAVPFLVSGAEDDVPRGGVTPGPLDLATVTPEIADHYRFAAAHADEYASLPCFCGCEEFLDHTGLLDCFVRQDGAWEAHASGCGVCIGESATARQMLDDGHTVPSVREAVVAKFGTSPITAPPR